MAFSDEAIAALSEQRIKPFAKIETKLSSENAYEPWHEIIFSDCVYSHDSSEFASELKFRAIDPESSAIDPYRDDASESNYLRTGSRIRLMLGITYRDETGEITEYRQAFKGFITKLTPFVDEGFWGVEVVAHDDLIRARGAVAKIDSRASIEKITDDALETYDQKLFYGDHVNWIAGMETIKRTFDGIRRIVAPDEYQVLENAGGIEFFESQDPLAIITAEYYRYDGNNLHVSEVMRLALEYPSENGGLGLDSDDYDLIDTSENNPDPSKRLPLIRFIWDESDGGPIEIYNHLLNQGLIPSNLKFWFDSDDSKWRLQYVYQKDLTNPETPHFEPDFEVARTIAFDDPADSEELYTRVMVIGRRHSPRNLAREGTCVMYPLPTHPGYNASFSAPSDLEGASNEPSNVIDGSLNTQFIWVLGEKVGESTADGAIVSGTESSSNPEFNSWHPYNEIAPVYIDLGSVATPSRVIVHLGANRFGTDRNPGRPPMLVSVEVANVLENALDMNDPNWTPLSEKAYRVFANANEMFDLSRDRFLVHSFRYIRVLFHFGMFYKWKPERRYIEYPIRDIAVYEDDRVIGTDQVDETRFPSVFERYCKRGYRTYMHEDSSLQTQEEVDQRAWEILGELVRSYLDRESTIAWDPRFRMHKFSEAGGKVVYGLTVREVDLRYETSDSRLVTRFMYDIDSGIVRFSGTNYFKEVE